jgi:hypothetical protein
MSTHNYLLAFLSDTYIHRLHGLTHAWFIGPLEEYVGPSVRYLRSVKCTEHKKVGQERKSSV